jgi:hypothetical protein
LLILWQVVCRCATPKEVPICKRNSNIQRILLNINKSESALWSKGETKSACMCVLVSRAPFCRRVLGWWTQLHFLHVLEQNTKSNPWWWWFECLTFEVICWIKLWSWKLIKMVFFFKQICKTYFLWHLQEPSNMHQQYLCKLFSPLSLIDKLKDVKFVWWFYVVRENKSLANFPLHLNFPHKQLLGDFNLLICTI